VARRNRRRVQKYSTQGRRKTTTAAMIEEIKIAWFLVVSMIEVGPRPIGGVESGHGSARYGKVSVKSLSFFVGRPAGPIENFG